MDMTAEKIRDGTMDLEPAMMIEARITELTMDESEDPRLKKRQWIQMLVFLRMK